MVRIVHPTPPEGTTHLVKVYWRETRNGQAVPPLLVFVNTPSQTVRLQTPEAPLPTVGIESVEGTLYRLPLDAVLWIAIDPVERLDPDSAGS